MLLTTLGVIRILADGLCIEYDAKECCFDRSPVSEKPIVGCYRISVDAKKYRSVSCLLEFTGDAIPNSGSSGECYMTAEFIKEDVILTIGIEDENAAFASHRLPNGVRYDIIGECEKLHFGVAWATDYEGADDVRTWYAADPTMQ